MKAKNDKEWHRLVCEREGYICERCDKDFSYPCYFDIYGVNRYVCGHHIKSKGAHPALRLETDNGMCVDDKCHKKEHAKLTQKPTED